MFATSLQQQPNIAIKEIGLVGSSGTVLTMVGPNISIARAIFEYIFNWQCCIDNERVYLLTVYLAFCFHCRWCLFRPRPGALLAPLVAPDPSICPLNWGSSLHRVLLAATGALLLPQAVEQPHLPKHVGWNPALLCGLSRLSRRLKMRHFPEAIPELTLQAAEFRAGFRSHIGARPPVAGAAVFWPVESLPAGLRSQSSVPVQWQGSVACHPPLPGRATEESLGEYHRLVGAAIELSPQGVWAMPAITTQRRRMASVSVAFHRCLLPRNQPRIVVGILQSVASTEDTLPTPDDCRPTLGESIGSHPQRHVVAESPLTRVKEVEGPPPTAPEVPLPRVAAGPLLHSVGRHRGRVRVRQVWAKKRSGVAFAGRCERGFTYSTNRGPTLSASRGTPPHTNTELSSDPR